jgi:hypothetical protein
VAVRQLLPPGPPDPALPPPAQLGEVLTAKGLGGILRIDARLGDGPPQDRIAMSVIRLADGNGSRASPSVAAAGSKASAAAPSGEAANSGVITVEIPRPSADPVQAEAPGSGASQ